MNLVTPVTFNGVSCYVGMDGIEVQHDTMPIYLYSQILADLS
jgi:hypothetical protein